MSPGEAPAKRHAHTPFWRPESLAGGRALNRELAETGVRRLGLMALVYGAVHLAYLFLPHAPTAPDAFPRVFSISMMAISLGVFLATRYVKLDPWLMLDLGLLFEVLGAAGIEIWILNWQGGWWEGAETVWLQGISWTCVWIVCFPLLVPTTKGKAALAAVGGGLDAVADAARRRITRRTLA